MNLARVTGTLWATRRVDNADGATLQLIQPLTAELEPMGEPLCACDTVGAGPGELVLYVTAYEAVIPFVTRSGGAGLGTKVPMDAAIVGIVEQHERVAAWRPGDAGQSKGKSRGKSQREGGGGAGAGAGPGRTGG